MRNELLNELKLERSARRSTGAGRNHRHGCFPAAGGCVRRHRPVYIPQADKLLIPIRDRLIRDEYNGSNVYALCKKVEI